MGADATLERVDHVTPLMVETLEDGLSRSRGRSVRIRKLEREASRSSTFKTERFRVTLDEGDERLSVYFKDLHPEHQVTDAWALRRTDRLPSAREVQMYQSVLSPERFGTLAYYGSRWEPERGHCWLFIEDGGQRMLQSERDLTPWASACRWVAGFHAATKDVAPEQTAFLPVYDESYYRRAAEQVGRLIARVDAATGAVLQRGLDHFTANIEWLSALPRSVIHGQYFGKNIMLRPEEAEHPVAVIDWETAAVGPGVFDLASISSGKWTADQREAMWLAYAAEYQQATGVPLEWEAFRRELVAVAVFHALEWLVWWSQHPVPKRFPKFLHELERLL